MAEPKPTYAELVAESERLPSALEKHKGAHFDALSGAQNEIVKMRGTVSELKGRHWGEMSPIFPLG